MRLADVSPVIRGQLDAVVAVGRELLDEDLVGIYLHGSLAMGCFNPIESDLDLLAVVRRRTIAEEKRQLRERLSRLAGRAGHGSRRPLPRPLEISFLAWGDLHPWRYPVHVDCRWAERWRFRGPEGDEPDLASHVTVARARGHALYGPPPEEVFPEVPRADFVDSALAHVGRDLRHGRAGVDGVLNAGRTMAAVMEGAVMSKEEGGHWLLAHAPPDLHRLVAAALATYRGDANEGRLDRADQARFGEWWLGWVAERMAGSPTT